MAADVQEGPQSALVVADEDDRHVEYGGRDARDAVEPRIGLRVEDGEITMLGVRSHNNWSFARHRPLGLSVASTRHHIGRPPKVSAAIGESSNAERN